MAARLVRSGDGAMPACRLPEDRDWRLVTTAGEGLDGLHAEPAAPRALEKGEVRVAVEAVGLNFSDVLISVGAVEMDPMLGDEFCGRIIGGRAGRHGSRRRRPRSWPWHRHLPARRGHTGRDDGPGPGRRARGGTGHDTNLIRVSRVGIPDVRAPGRRPSADTHGIRRRRPRGNPIGAGRGRGGVRYGKRPQAGLPAILGHHSRLRQPQHRLQRCDPAGNRRRRRHGRPEQPHGPGFCRGELGVPGDGRPVCGDGPEGHLDRGADGGGAPGRRLLRPHGGRAQATRPRSGGGVPQSVS